MEKCAQTEADIRQVTNELAEFLIKKNRAYGDSALNPRRIFSRADLIEQLKVRLDDKISRLENAKDPEVDSMGENVEEDLLGYLILLRIARLRKAIGLTGVVDDSLPARPLSIDHKRFPEIERPIARDGVL